MSLPDICIMLGYFIRSCFRAQEGDINITPIIFGSNNTINIVNQVEKNQLTMDGNIRTSNSEEEMPEA
jgi:hypothetical protein